MRSWSSRLSDAAFAALFNAGYPLAFDGPHDEQLAFMGASAAYLPITVLQRRAVNAAGLTYLPVSWMRDRYEVQIVREGFSICNLDVPCTAIMARALTDMDCRVHLTSATPELWVAALGSNREYQTGDLALAEALRCVKAWIALPENSHVFSYRPTPDLAISAWWNDRRRVKCVLYNVALADVLASELRPHRFELYEKHHSAEEIEKWRAALPGVEVAYW